MKTFLEDMTNELVQKGKQTFEFGQMLFTKLVNRVDLDLTKTIQLLKDKQEKLLKFVQRQEVLLNEILEKEAEVKRLSDQIQQFRNSSKSIELNILRKELNAKLDDLLKSQRSYYDLESKIEEEQRRVQDLLADKQKMEKDRYALKTIYDQMKETLAENQRKTSLLEKELEELKAKEIQYQALFQQSATKEEIVHFEMKIKDMQEEIQFKQTEHDQLKREKEIMIQKQKELEADLLQKITSVSKLSSELNVVNHHLEKIQKEKNVLKNQLHAKESSLKQSNKKIQTLESQLLKLKTVEIELEFNYQLAQEEARSFQQQLIEYKQDFTQEMNVYKELLEEIEKDLLDKQNELAIEKANSGEPGELTKEEKKILEKEFEPRFKTIYGNCIIYPEFISDFFQITQSDRIKVEFVIAQLNFNYLTYQSNVRPKTVKGKSKNLLEFEFGTDSVGRIYVNIENNLVHIHRLSRTKNGRGKLTQDNVIEWLKRNI